MAAGKFLFGPRIRVAGYKIGCVLNMQIHDNPYSLSAGCHKESSRYSMNTGCAHLVELNRLYLTTIFTVVENVSLLSHPLTVIRCVPIDREGLTSTVFDGVLVNNAPSI